eukprot:1648563-Prymnesium_polylepis.1
MAMVGVRVASSEVRAALHKPDTVARSVNATLKMRGTDLQNAANWSVVNALELPGWLSLPLDGAPTDARAIASGDTDVNITLVLNASGWREQAASYSAVLQIRVRSAIAAVTRVQPLQVWLSIQARTSQLVWGRVPLGAVLCTAATLTAVEESPIPVLAQRRVNFTACDSDGLPVDHQLPSPIDSRRPRISLAVSPDASLPIEYMANGAYHALVSVPTHGPFQVLLRLDGATAVLTGTAVCPEERALNRGDRCAEPALCRAYAAGHWAAQRRARSVQRASFGPTPAPRLPSASCAARSSRTAFRAVWTRRPQRSTWQRAIGATRLRQAPCTGASGAERGVELTSGARAAVVSTTVTMVLATAALGITARDANFATRPPTLRGIPGISTSSMRVATTAATSPLRPPSFLRCSTRCGCSSGRHSSDDTFCDHMPSSAQARSSDPEAVAQGGDALQAEGNHRSVPVHIGDSERVRRDNSTRAGKVYGVGQAAGV